MTREYIPPFSHFEEQVTGRLLLGTPTAPKVRQVWEAIDGGYLFSVTGPAEYGRDAIAHAMTQPIGEKPDWREVERGLRSIVYPKRSVERLDRSNVHSNRLRMMGKASRELAQILEGKVDPLIYDDDLIALFKRMPYLGTLRDSEDKERYVEFLRKLGYGDEPFMAYDETLLNVPVFDEDSAVHYAEQMLYHMNPRFVLSELAKRAEPATIRKLEQLLPKQSVEIPGLSAEDQAVMEIGVMRYFDGKAYLDVVHELMDKLVVGVRSEATYDELGTSGGTRDPEYYIRRSDVAKYLDPKYDIRMSIERELRDHDEETGLPKHQVKVIVRKNALLGYAQVAWTNRGGVRSFAFPTNPIEWSMIHPMATQASSLLGAAIVAQQIGVNELGIDYEKKLARYIGRRSEFSAPLAKAGMLGTVLDNEVLSYPYFVSVERHALQ